jgi:uncharacterized membrane protein YqjE
VGDNEQDRPGGIFASLQRMGDITLAAAQNRIELLVVELQQEKERVLRLFVLAAAVVFLGNMAVGIATFTIVYLAGEKARGPLLICLTLLYFLATGVGYFQLRKQLSAGPRPLDGTLSELEKDRQWLSSRK